MGPYLRQQIGEDPQAAAGEDPGGHSDEAAHEEDAEDDDDEGHGHVQGHQLDGAGRQREHGAQRDAQERQPAQHIVPRALRPIVGPGIEKLLLKGLQCIIEGESEYPYGLLRLKSVSSCKHPEARAVILRHNQIACDCGFSITK